MNTSRLSLSIKALRELGPRKLGLFALYKLGLHSGYFRWRTANRQPIMTDDERLSTAIQPLLSLPDPSVVRGVIGVDGISQLVNEANEIVEGRIRLFGGKPVQLNLVPPGKLSHWADMKHEPKTSGEIRDRSDIKFVWEPARFGWVFTLGRAYHLTADERYPGAFWRSFEIFQQANPVNQGPNWESGQEVALRLIAFIFAAQIFAESRHSTAQRRLSLAHSVASHASRIPLTMIYARSQNNNHLLSEAVGLITASLALPEHPQSGRWSNLGWKWFKRGLQSQIADDGAYMQQSTNYHRLMLQLALWVYCITGQLRVSGGSERFEPHSVTPKLKQATRWLLSLTDPESGHVPNLGPNDGAYILPLTVQPFSDFRPVLQTASAVFLGEQAVEPGAWDEMSLWLGNGRSTLNRGRPPMPPDHGPDIFSPTTIKTPHSWAYLRAATFRDRPGHADQLHIDLWWRGLNVAQDAGTYLYNASPPWDNALTHTAVHNTVMVDNRQQMTAAGRFLYLDRAQAVVIKREREEHAAWERIVATHDGYRHIGVVHQRSVTADQEGNWKIEDQLFSSSRSPSPKPRTMRIQWLLPDWEWKIDDSNLAIEIFSPYGWITLTVSLEGGAKTSLVQSLIVRAGELLHGAGPVIPSWGWVSPTYSVKQPALSFVVTVVEKLPITLTSEWSFPE